MRARSPLRAPRASGDGGPDDLPPVRTTGAERASFDLEAEPLLSVGPPGAVSAGAAAAAADAIDWRATALLFVFPALGGALFGYDIGATSGALVSLTDPAVSGTAWGPALSSLEGGLVVSLSLLGALAGSAGALAWGDALGRRRELLLAAALYAAGAAGAAAAPGLGALYAARVVYGLGIGFAMHAAPAYIAEAAPPRVRGLLISLKEGFIVGGILAGYVAGAYLVAADGGWRGMWGAAAPAALLLAAGMAYLPESPRWLVLSGGGAPAAAAALRRLQGSACDEGRLAAEVAGIEAAVLASPRPPAPGGGAFAALAAGALAPRYRRPLAAGLSLMVLQQVTGQPSVLYYAATIFKAAGFDTSGEAAAVSVALGVFKLAATGVAVATVDSWGRRPLLLWGVSALTAALLALGALAAGVVPLPEGAAGWANLGALLLYVGAYQLSFGPVSWLVVGEVFPLRVRGQAIALATLANFSSNFAVSLALPPLRAAAGPAATYFLFAAVGVLAVVVIDRAVPETKGKSLEEIEAMWGERGE